MVSLCGKYNLVSISLIGKYILFILGIFKYLFMAFALGHHGSRGNKKKLKQIGARPNFGYSIRIDFNLYRFALLLGSMHGIVYWELTLTLI